MIILNLHFELLVSLILLSFIAAYQHDSNLLPRAIGDLCDLQNQRGMTAFTSLFSELTEY